MNSAKGLTLLEVLVAIVVLAVGVLMAAAMQTSALRASSDASAIQGVTKIAEAEIELRRQIDLTTTAGKATTCKTAVQTGYTCQVEVRPCQLSGTALNCTGVGGSSADADQVVVTVTGSRSKTLALTTVKAR
jgi:prepilin-type N-terminal cleavage/methylation domain-containing protein